MGQGSKPGERRGGRGRGTKNLRTIEDELNAGMDAERTFSEARAHHKKLAKEVIADFMAVFMGIATRYQPLAKDGTPNPDFNEDKFERWSMNALHAAKWLAPYQSPTFRQVTLANPAPDHTQRHPNAAKAVSAILDLMAQTLRAPPIINATISHIAELPEATPVDYLEDGNDKA
jgi:hypothetical protein